MNDDVLYLSIAIIALTLTAIFLVVTIRLMDRTLKSLHTRTQDLEYRLALAEAHLRRLTLVTTPNPDQQQPPTTSD